VISDALASEASTYPTTLNAQVVPNVLPHIKTAGLSLRHRQFAARLELDLRRPILINPVRVFRVKGVHLALHFLAELKVVAERESLQIPYLLVFGALGEDPDYAEEVLKLCHQLDLSADARFLDGVPLTSYLDPSTGWHLDEIDLLQLSSFSCGGVVFTPGVPDVETIGLGPALAAVAGLPCALTEYNAFRPVYGHSFACTKMGTSIASIHEAANEFMSVLQSFRRQDDSTVKMIRENQRIVEQIFPSEPWINLWSELKDNIVDQTSKARPGQVAVLGTF
jgi:hypothetical protein